jgi:hypothetical protein
MSFRIRSIMLLALLAAVALPSAVHAAGWCAPVDGCTVLLGFGDRYDSVTHRGADLAAPPGAEVSAPTVGTVTFAGWVPADGGGTCGAVTVDIGGGLRVSLLPLQEVFVSVGDPLAAGEVVGLLAASGDDSSAVPHLHLGLRQGDTYVDPGPYLPVTAAVAVPEPVAAAEPAESVTVPSWPAAPVPESTGAGVSARAVEPDGATTVPGGGEVVAAESSAGAALGSVQPVSEESLAAVDAVVGLPSLTPHAAPVGADRPVPSALRPQGGRLVRGARALVGNLPLTSTTGAALALAAAGVLTMGWRRPVRVRA